MFVTVDGKIFYLEHGRLRTIDENGNVKTVFGQSYSFGDGGLVTSARVVGGGATPYPKPRTA